MPIPAAVIGALGASARGWNLAYVDTFDTNPSGKYSTRSGSPSYTWDSTNKWLTISNSTTQGFVAYDAFGGFTGKVAFEMDVKFVDDSAARKHWGFFLDSGASGVNGYRAATLDGAGWGLGRWVDSSETSLGNFTTTFNPVIGTTYTLRIERDASGVFSFYVDGVKMSNTVTNTQYATIRPGFFMYGSTIQINELRVYT